MKIKNKILLILVVVASCSSAPVKDFLTLQYLPQNGNCHERLLDNGNIEVNCYYDDGEIEEKDWIVIRKSDYNKELDYQSLLINRCESWKK